MVQTQCTSRAAPLAFAPRRRLFAELIALIKEWRRRARSRRELAALCDRCLRDMGATRYDADMEMRKPFWRA